MKFIINEKIKHCIVGMIVIFSVGVILLPTFMEKSNRHFDGNVQLSVKLPSKPIKPEVNIPSKGAMFKTINVARVNLEPVSSIKPELIIAKATSLSSSHEEIRLASNIPAINNKKILVEAKPTIQTPSKLITQKPVVVHSPYYTVQLAMFSQQDNAKSLVRTLQQKGYQASYKKIITDRGVWYKVVVGQVAQMKQAQVLQEKLASVTQIKGLVVETRES